MRVEFRIFRASFRSWEELFAEAADFASRLGRDRLISISHSEDQNQGVVTVWYWSGAAEARAPADLAAIEREIEAIESNEP